jgi:putative membrane protein
MLQHLLIGMFAPLGLVMGAPVTLALRTIRPKGARRVSRFLRTSGVRIIANPVTALVLNTGGMALLYFTPCIKPP